ncbi:hypothetical protein FK518_30690 [Klebsiella pneumoniae]|nr:hypothetical protein [Klebsiella pneumoniae]
MKTSFQFDCREDEWSCFLVRKSCSSLTGQNRRQCSMDGVYRLCSVWIGSPFNVSPPGVLTFSRETRLPL